MGPSPSPRHSLTMTAIKEKIIVIGGELKLGSKADDNMVYILDSGKCKKMKRGNRLFYIFIFFFL
jgi:hypothetical protein